MVFSTISVFFQKSLFNSRLDYFWQRASLMSHQILDSHIVKINYKVNVRFKFSWRFNRPRGYESRLNYRIIWSILSWLLDIKIRFWRIWAVLIDRKFMVLGAHLCTNFQSMRITKRHRIQLQSTVNANAPV